jgi:hypothetical protein
LWEYDIARDCIEEGKVEEAFEKKAGPINGC